MATPVQLGDHMPQWAAPPQNPWTRTIVGLSAIFTHQLSDWIP
ncbi:hypothetical protein [Streptomyces sp. TE33382]